MTASDGYVLGATKVVDHGANNLRWNLVIVGDGYTAAQINQYHTDVQNFINIFRATPPFDGELFCAINIHRVDVVSNQSGADNPDSSLDAVCLGDGSTANTYFDATYCSVSVIGRLDRLLTIDSNLAKTVAANNVSKVDQVLCIVNHSKYGGAGGDVATCSTDPQAALIAIHEIGHSAFGLADEYGGGGSAPAAEPPEPNVTINTNRATNKWRHLIAATTPMPSSCDSSCVSSGCTPPVSPPAAGAVGTYEGGQYTDCGVYRPLPSCMMRDYGPFCPVCTEAIRQVLTPWLPVESINLATPSLTFLNVPAGMGGVGVTTQRAIVFEVVTCRYLTFHFVGNPTGGFTAVAPTSINITADPILPVTYARLWVAYTSTNPGDSASGTATVRCDQTGQTWVININANTIARPRAAVGLVLDRSYSMTEDAGDAIPKVQKLREAANAFISIMQADDGIGLVRFNQAAQRLMDIEEAGAAPGGSGRTTAIGHIAGSDIDPSGNTSIGDGVVKGKQLLDDGQAAAADPYDVTAMVVLTDGQWNTPPPLSSVAGSITANTYAVGLGLPSNISVPALTELCQGHNGYLLITGAISTDQSMRLSKYFLQILAGVTNAQVASDPRGVLTLEGEHRIPVWINEADYGMDMIVLSPYPHAIRFELEAPDGTRITPGAGGLNAQYVLSQYAAYYRCALPVDPANEPGTRVGQWWAVLSLDRRRLGRLYKAVANPYQAGIAYEFVSHVYSSLTFAAGLTQSGYDLGATARITAALRQYDAPLTDNAQAWAEITRPDGALEVVALAQGPGGDFGADYKLWLPGVYPVRIRARGETERGVPFEREQTRTATAVRGGDRDPGLDGGGPGGPADLCLWLDCLRANPELLRILAARLKELGIDLWDVLKCLDERCTSVEARLEARRPQARAAGADPEAIAGLPLDRLLELMDARLRAGREQLE